mmetsp:Transcript_9175/g.10832  ORF Transcript_9175/g.10832 Transcript_9175/m.10832 type:complete len:108 (-) Transcript_9175:17-340(-)
MRLWPKNVTAAKLAELSLCVLSLSVALPGSVALFKQQSMLTREQIDPELRDTKQAIKVDDKVQIKEISLIPTTPPATTKSEPAKDAKEESVPAKDELVQEFYFNKGM